MATSYDAFLVLSFLSISMKSWILYIKYILSISTILFDVQIFPTLATGKKEPLQTTFYVILTQIY